MLIVNFSFFFLLLVFLANIGFAKDKSHKRRHIKSHIHGSGKMNLAVDGSKIFIELEIPAHDVVGFEYLPTKPDEQTKVAQAINILSQESLVFETPPGVKCKIQGKPKVESELDSSKKGSHKYGESHQNHSHKYEKKSKVSHSEFKASYTFTCNLIRSLDFTLFKEIKALKKMKAQVITSEKQFSQTLTPKSNRIFLGK